MKFFYKLGIAIENLIFSDFWVIVDILVSCILFLNITTPLNTSVFEFLFFLLFYMFYFLFMSFVRLGISFIRLKELLKKNNVIGDNCFIDYEIEKLKK